MEESTNILSPPNSQQALPCLTGMAIPATETGRPQDSQQAVQIVSPPSTADRPITQVNASPFSPSPAANSSLTQTSPSPAQSDSLAWSGSVNTLLQQPPSTLPQRVLLGGIAFSLAFGLWAWVGQIDEVGHALGKLEPQGAVYKIHPVDAGKVEQIGVREGDMVKAGQLLFSLEHQIATDEVERLQRMVSAYQVEANQKQALLQNLRLTTQTRNAIAHADIQAQTAAIAQIRATSATTRRLLNQYQLDIAGFEARVARIKPLVDEGAIPKEKQFEVEQELRDRQSVLIKSQGELAHSLAEGDRLEAGLIQKKAEGERNRLDAEQQIQQLEVQITELNSKISETANLLNTAKTKLKQRFIYAPVDGQISTLNIHNIGEVVQPGQSLAEMGAGNAPLILMASLPNREAGFVKTGMPVRIKFDAYPYQDYGMIPGRVIATSPDIKPDPKLGAVYKVQIVLERNYITANHQTIQLTAGKTATAEIVIRQRRILDVLFDPIRQLQKGGLSL